MFLIELFLIKKTLVGLRPLLEKQNKKQRYSFNSYAYNNVYSKDLTVISFKEF